MKCLLNAGLSISLLFVGSAQAQSLPAAVDSLKKAGDSLVVSNTDLKLPAEDVAKLQSQIDTLSAAALSVPRAERKDYAKSVLAQIEAINSLLAVDDTDKRMRAFQDVDADLSLKLAAKNFGATNSLLGKVNVIVRTKKDGQEVTGIVVGANPIARAGSNQIMWRFSKLSSPTAKPLPPGRYEFILLQGSAILARQTADVGLDMVFNGDAADVDLDLVVP